MKAFQKLVSGLAIAGLAVACGDDPIPGVTGNGGTTVADIAGAWTASQFEYTMVAPPSTALDLIALTGEATVTAAADGSYNGTLLLPGAPGAAPFSGDITISGSSLTLGFDMLTVIGPITLDPADPFEFDSFTLSGNQLTLSASVAEFDFTLGLCGTATCPEVPATLVIILNR